MTGLATLGALVARNAARRLAAAPSAEVNVPCDGREHAAELVEMLVAQGLPRTALRIRGAR
jgi:hypothetical protein